MHHGAKSSTQSAFGRPDKVLLSEETPYSSQKSSLLAPLAIDCTFHSRNGSAPAADDHGNPNKKLSHRRDSARCVKWPFKITQGHPLLSQSTRHICLCPPSRRGQDHVTSLLFGK